MQPLDFMTTEVGRRFTAGPVLITKEKILSFAREYDPAPFHLDEDFASKHRHGQLVAPGVMTFMAVWAEFIRSDPWGENMLGGRLTTIEWLKPTFAGDRVRGVLWIEDKFRRNAYNGVVIVKSEYFNQDDVKVMTNVTEMVVAGKEE